MKTLYVMRHAKSDWTGQAADLDRPLNGRGRRDAPRVAAFLARLEAPARILSSPALRARQTAEALMASFEATGPGARTALTYDQRLYGADAGALTEVVSQVEAAVPSLLVVGHNPGMEEWVRQLCGARVRLPTATLAALALEIPAWASLPGAQAQLQWLVIPGLLKAMEG
ncbi:MAG: histidine phosphatase family protein [Gemmatimonadota bacterium]